MWVHLVESHSFCVCVCAREFLGMTVYARRRLTQTEAGQVRGGTHPLNSPVLTGDKRDSAVYPITNRIN